MSENAPNNNNSNGAPPAPPTVEGNTPKETLYVKNLNNSIKQARLRKTLYSAFSPYGKVKQIVSSRAERLRGQAWIVFEDIPSATTAMRQLQGTMFLDKPLVIDFAKTKSDIIAIEDGTFVPREKRPREEKKQVKVEKQNKTSTPSTNNVPAMDNPAPPSLPPPTQNVPNKILFVQELPEECTEEMLSILFKQYHGFKEVRTVPGKKGLAFVEFGDEIQAGIALQGLYGFKLTPKDQLKVMFAKK